MFQAGETAMQTQVTNKLCCFELVEVLYTRLSKDDVNSKNSRINSVYLEGAASTDGKELTKAIIRYINFTALEIVDFLLF